MCCVSGCTTTSKRDKQKLNGIKFYCFPIESTHMPWLVEKRQMWINAVRNHK
ncbi:hypothetical protein K1T71_014205 [Dendrolimus kikuchii]|uniref:Uncharacterized protein n=1 Tax=Dendrolimus kikuchii TaxID=765133 RepID=A0ACC1CFK9_9NEOP|nr:hypothetical protein K1T71_014205 [Dendrolimus kikuchii]